jgi:hypothetical protein
MLQRNSKRQPKDKKHKIVRQNIDHKKMNSKNQKQKPTENGAKNINKNKKIERKQN